MKRREASELRSARHRARQKKEWEDLRQDAQELRQRVVVSEQKLEMVLGYLLNNDPEILHKIHPIVAGTFSLETSSPTQDNEMLELAYEQVVQEDPSIPGLAEEICTKLPDS